MRLYVARHGDAGAFSADPAVERARSLTQAGREGVERVALWIAGEREHPRLIVCSPFARAQQTADILGRVLGAPVSTEDELQPDRDLGWWVGSVLANEDLKRVMLVGHTDNLSPLLVHLRVDRVDPLVKGEARRLKVDRGGDVGAVERWRAAPPGSA